ncbi:MAG TPA: ATP-binding protein [Acidimicrobiia bacterium]|nr:ATP-binding protein [Acidimicrobiia bacterium]
MSSQTRGVPPIDDTLRWVVVGFRILALAWMGALVGTTLAGDPGANRAVVAWTLALATVWTGVTVAHATRPRWFRTIPWMIADGLVALWVSISPFVAGSEDLFFGSYPISSLLVLAYAGGPWPALGTAALMAAGQVVAAFGEVGRTSTQVAGDIGAFVITALAGGWGFSVLRRYDQARSEAEEALEEERAARRRAHDRAEIAAHLHDSVLQTLALIQQDPADPRRVGALARGQERELRQYLEQIASPYTHSLRAALRRTAGEVEDLHQVKVDMVVIGDCEMDERLEALVRATREALVNAARYSGAETISLFGEASPSGVAVTVRDRGRGFDPAHTTNGRGIAESIVGRMQRHGGTAEVRSRPGEGTEVDLHLARDDG